MGKIEKKMEMMAIMIPTYIKDTSKEDGQGSYNEGDEDERRTEVDGKKNKEAGEKDPPKINPWLDHTEHLLKEFLMFNNYFANYVGFTSIPKGNCPQSLPC